MSKIYRVETFAPDGTLISTDMFHESEVDDLIFLINRNPRDDGDVLTHKVWTAEVEEWDSIA